MMSRQMRFFMTKEDLLILSDELESKIDIAFYHRMNIKTVEGRRFNSIRELPDLGINKCGSHHVESFLVLPEQKDVVIEEFPQKDGNIHYAIDQKMNEDSIIFWPGGFYGDSYLIHGNIGTISNTEVSEKIYNYFYRAIRKICKKQIDSFWYSENVRKLEKVRLITISIRENPAYDIKI